MNILLIDNYDSFTYNLFQYITEEGGADVNVTVWRNDRFELDDVERFDKIILSPGPGVPDEAGLLKAVIRRYAPTKPILGVCLGEQAIGEVFGAEIHNLPTVFHGIQSKVSIVADDYIFSDMPDNILVGCEAEQISCRTGSDGVERRRTGNGAKTPHLRCARHTVPPRVDTHSGRKAHDSQLYHSLEVGT